MTAVAFWHRAVALFAARAITGIRRCLTGDGSCYRSMTWADALAATGAEHEWTRPTRLARTGRSSATTAPSPAGYTPSSTNGASRSPSSWTTTTTNGRRVALGGHPPIGQSAGSDERIVLDQSPEPLVDIPLQLSFEDVALPMS